MSSYISRIDITKIDQGTRRRLFDYVLRKGVSHRDLGIDYTYFHRVKTGKYRVTDNVLLKILEHLSEEEFRRVVGGRASEYYGLVKEGVVDYGLVIDILNKAREDPFIKSLIIREAKELEKTLEKNEIIVSESDVEKFKKLLANKSPNTAKDRLRYLLKALNELNWVLSPEKINEFLAEKEKESRYLAHHYAKSLKLFIKLVYGRNQLYNSFSVPQVRGGVNIVVPEENEIVEIAKNIDWEIGRAYLILLAETGLRPTEVISLRLGDIDLDKRIIRVSKLYGTKRAYISFIHGSTARYLRYIYLPQRENYLNNIAPKLERIGLDPKKLSDRLFPTGLKKVRRVIEETSERVIGRKITPMMLRKVFATIMIKRGAPPYVINILQGRVPPKEFEVLERNYIGLNLEDLREYYERCAPKISEHLIKLYDIASIRYLLKKYRSSEENI